MLQRVACRPEPPFGNGQMVENLCVASIHGRLKQMQLVRRAPLEIRHLPTHTTVGRIVPCVP